MHVPVLHGIWFVTLYCLFIWGGFALALFLADPRKRFREACVGALLVLILSSVLSMLSSFAAEQLETSIGMTMSFQLVGVWACLMAASRVSQMLSWARTWLAAALGLIAYIAVALIFAGIMAGGMQ